jgi:endonuclease/exonuclease/phosphatase family metal-dependent hydrolase
VKAILGFWGSQGSTVILGDFNIRPGEPEGELLKGAGLRDAFVASGAPGEGSTSRSNVRIDYIWVSPDLGAGDFSVSGTWASDHRAIAATVSP